jgi:hypothetical protein
MLGYNLKIRPLPLASKIFSIQNSLITLPFDAIGLQKIVVKRTANKHSLNQKSVCFNVGLSDVQQMHYSHVSSVATYGFCDSTVLIFVLGFLFGTYNAIMHIAELY